MIELVRLTTGSIEVRNGSIEIRVIISIINDINMMYYAKVHQNKGPEVPRGALNSHFDPRCPLNCLINPKIFKIQSEKMEKIFFFNFLKNFLDL